MSIHRDRIEHTVAQTDLDFFWHMMGNLGDRQGYSVLEEAHEEEVDDASAAFMAGNEL